jgi:phosphatidylinositol glycan class B
MVAAGALVALVSAWFNQGFFCYDEHFQILEFAWYKLGGTPASGLAWEFHARMRPALQPLIAAGVIKALHVPALLSPFFATFVLRLLSGLLALWVSLELCARMLPAVRSLALKRVMLGGLLFLWFLPYTHGRFASENWGGLLFFGGLCLAMDAVDEGSGQRAVVRRALAGVLWAAAFYCRFQIGLAIAGAGMWMLLVGRARLRVLASLTAAFVLTCALNTAIDHWLYGVWVLTPVNYFHANVVEGKASTFGTSPWWFYFAQLFALLVPPFSPLLVFLLGAGVWFARRHVLVWTVIPFIVGHTVLPHKETRFLIPVTYALVPLIVLGADRLPLRLQAAFSGWWGRPSMATARWVFVGLNVLGLAVMTFKPSSEIEIIYRRLYEESERHPIVLFTRSGLPYDMAGDLVDFYRPGNVELKMLGDVREVRDAMAALPGHVFVFQQSLQAPLWMANAQIACTPLAQTIPLWVLRYNLNDWTSRMSHWSVFGVSPAVGRGGC